FNTNNLWIDLPALAETQRARSGVLELPLIVNRKTVDPKDAQSTPGLQLETAMGAAIALWPDAQAIRVPRTRFGPVKTTNDLLAVRSDAYVLGADSAIALDPSRAGRPPFIDLDGRHFKLVGDFERHFPRGVPSLVGCQSLTVRGNVHFGADVVITGEVRLAHPAGDDSDAATDGEPLRIPDGAVLGR
ncbi:MAG: UTP--glucose-phosphate uridylyltransferase, partial [Frankiales bacterium]|nr:UTP--glucose-phosphate uridylyltransferase [Frankiales bacterium]